MALSVDERLKLIRRNTSEILGDEDLEGLLKKKKTPVAYIGTAVTGKPHIGYFVWGLKVADLLKAGFKVKILLADLHGALDNCPWDLLEKRYDYYSKVIPLMIEAMGADISKLEFVKGSEIQLTKEYTLDMYKMASVTSVHDCHKAASEVVKLGDSPKLSGYIYPLMQALDEVYLGVDMQIGGTDQRKIMVLAREKLPQIGYEKRIELLNPLIPGLVGKKMSASVVASKIDLMDDAETIRDKVRKADFVAGEVDNGVMALLKYIIFTLKGDKKEKFVVERPAKFGGNLEYSSYEKLEKDVVEKKVHPLDLKNALAEEIIKLLSGVDKKRKDLEKVAKLAYAVE